jgi:hypothetical protein
MAERGSRWQRVQALLERWPAYAKGTGPERGLMAGGLAGLLAGGLCGAVLGMLNRELAGAVVGGLSAGVLGLALGALIGWAIPRRRVTLSAYIEIDDTREAFSPGETLNGFVVLSADGSALVHRAVVTLSCEGKFVRERPATNELEPPVYERQPKTYASEATTPVRQVRLRRGSQVRFPFSFVVPENAPPTHRGFGCMIRWMLRLNVEAQREVQAAPQEVTVASSPSDAPSGSSQAAVTCDAFHLALSLPQLQYAEGDAIQGNVVITPGGELTLTELRVALVRIERLTEGSGTIMYFKEGDPEQRQVAPQRQPAESGTTLVWLERDEPLAESAKFETAKSRRFPFALQLPRAWRPSVATADGVVRWQLSAIASRAGLPDVQTSLRVEVHTAAPWVGRVFGKAAS